MDKIISGPEWPDAVWIERGDGLAGVDPRLDREDGQFLVRWTEGQHERSVTCESINDSFAPGRIVFTGLNGTRWVFRELTLDLYERHVRPKTPQRLSFASRADLIASMRAAW